MITLRLIYPDGTIEERLAKPGEVIPLHSRNRIAAWNEAGTLLTIFTTAKNNELATSGANSTEKRKQR